MANVSYDTLTITINADSKQANTSINRLSKNLQKLDSTAKEIDKERILEVKELLRDIANIDFSNVAKGLQDVVKAFNAFNSKKFMSATNGGANLSGAYQHPNLKIIGDVSNVLNNFKPTGIEKLISELSLLPKTFEKVELEFKDTQGLINQAFAGQETFDLNKRLEEIKKSIN